MPDERLVQTDLNCESLSVIYQLRNSNSGLQWPKIASPIHLGKQINRNKISSVLGDMTESPS